MRSFMQTLCHCETNPSDSSPLSGVNTYLNSDLWAKLLLLLYFFSCLPNVNPECLVRTFYHDATRLSDPLNPGLGLNGVTSNCIRQIPLSPLPGVKCTLGHRKKTVHPGPTAGRIHFFSTGCHFTLGLCVWFFCIQRKFLCTPRQVLSRK